VLHFNTTRVIQQSPLDVLSLTDVVQAARRQVVEMVELLQAKIPAFRNAYLQKMAVHIGVRESRCVIGKYVLTVYEIPFRCLVPRGCRNLLIGSRCISAAHEAHSSLPVMPVVAGIGEAAGIGTALFAQRGILTEALDGREVRGMLGINLD
jgi:hypothetical protein